MSRPKKIWLFAILGSGGLLLIGRQQGFLPPWFQKVNRQGIEVRIIAVQGVVITLIAVLYAFIPSVSHAYWVFTALATQVYLIMYLLMFAAAVLARPQFASRRFVTRLSTSKCTARMEYGLSEVQYKSARSVGRS